jgi:hypothetical protein
MGIITFILLNVLTRLPTNNRGADRPRATAGKWKSHRFCGIMLL